MFLWVISPCLLFLTPIIDAIIKQLKISWQPSLTIFLKLLCVHVISIKKYVHTSLYHSHLTPLLHGQCYHLLPFLALPVLVKLILVWLVWPSSSSVLCRQHSISSGSVGPIDYLNCLEHSDRQLFVQSFRLNEPELIEDPTPLATFGFTYHDQGARIVRVEFIKKTFFYYIYFICYVLAIKRELWSQHSISSGSSSPLDWMSNNKGVVIPYQLTDCICIIFDREDKGTLVYMIAVFCHSSYCLTKVLIQLRWFY